MQIAQADVQRTVLQLQHGLLSCRHKMQLMCVMLAADKLQADYSWLCVLVLQPNKCWSCELTKAPKKGRAHATTVVTTT
jgi:hypothetical protein